VFAKILMFLNRPYPRDTAEECRASLSAKCVQTLVLMAALAMAATITRPAAAQTGLAELDRSFICPETLSSDAQRNSELQSFFSAMARIEPNTTVPHALLIRRALLIGHHCAQTLQSLEAKERSILSGDVLDQAWYPLGAGRGMALFISSNYLKPTFDPRYGGEHAVDTFVKIIFNSVQITNSTHRNYDTVVSHNIYYCRSGNYALIENDYFLNGRLQLKDRSTAKSLGGVDVFDVTPIVQGSLNAVGRAAACTGVVGDYS